jgi:Bacterial Ig-like domain (group 2)
MLRSTLVALSCMVAVVSCASDAGDFAPGPVCDALIVHGENDELLPLGAQLQLGFLYRPCDINDQAPRTTTWSSSNVGVATVTSSGLVSGRALGKATITATVPGGSAGLAIQVVAVAGP